ncbi:hypothetical protein B1748_21120 [Paenibacillus sp. MY03]|uniref:hypothetical protein n=1 Tax=Paenibacillus sp. MY03 TaxID=302980 RepID=UPI000B3CE0BE|nr:hypothetical protein [Paenibacillus sp. MY03]OUS74333.1 hypothetical protein B1748_21120 [Paenibacillus sp. MY03]
MYAKLEMKLLQSIIANLLRKWEPLYGSFGMILKSNGTLRRYWREIQANRRLLTIIRAVSSIRFAKCRFLPK